jgi:hypothetical protein
VPTFSKTKSKVIKKAPMIKAAFKFFGVLFRYSNRNNITEIDGIIHQLKGTVEGIKKTPSPKKKIINSII